MQLRTGNLDSLAKQGGALAAVPKDRGRILKIELLGFYTKA